MFGKMMNNFYYGKSGKGDYHKEDLPGTRWQLFWEMLKIRFSGLFRLNLVYAVAWLPVLFIVLTAVGNWYTGMVNVAEMQDAVEQGTMTLEAMGEGVAQFNDWVKALALQTLIILIPCIAITGPFTAGMAYVTRNWARDEHAFVWGDYRDAVKENWKQGLAISTITGFMPLILYVCWSFYGDLAAGNMLFLVPQILSVALVLIWLCSLLYMYPLMVTYRLRFRDLVRNGVLLTVGRLPMSVGLKLLSLVPVLLAAGVMLLTPYFQYAMMFIALYYILIGFALSRFIAASYSNAAFDRYINPSIEGAQVNRGLYKEDEEDLEEDGEMDA